MRIFILRPFFAQRIETQQVAPFQPTLFPIAFQEISRNELPMFAILLKLNLIVFFLLKIEKFFICFFSQKTLKIKKGLNKSL